MNNLRDLPIDTMSARNVPLAEIPELRGEDYQPDTVDLGGDAVELAMASGLPILRGVDVIEDLCKVRVALEAALEAVVVAEYHAAEYRDNRSIPRAASCREVLNSSVKSMFSALSRCAEASKNMKAINKYSNIIGMSVFHDS